jgi:hypothetical protein
MSTFTPICVPCAREMRCKKNGYFFKDYQAAAIWSGDMYECPKCKRQIVVGVGRGPVALDNEAAFERIAPHAGLELTREED